MKFVFFCHPPHMRSQSMPRFARMLGDWVAKQGHEVQYWAPNGTIHKLTQGLGLGNGAAKWASYVDQYLIFPLSVRWRLHRQPAETLFVFCDQALGPWVPLVKGRPHVVHAHDLLALRSALGLIPENPISLTGRLYQRYIRSGFQQAAHFICVSSRTMHDLRVYGGVQTDSMRVVFNGMNYPYHRVTPEQARAALQRAGLPEVHELILHVGGDQWYKNTAGVIRMYGAYARKVTKPLPLWMISPHPSSKLVCEALADLPSSAQVRFFQGIDNEALQGLYSMASALVFPSLAEGFGWPLIEAQACGCPVITTDDAPMNEIAGPQATYLTRLTSADDMPTWADLGGTVLKELVQSEYERSEERRANRMAWAQRFTADAAMQGYLQVYANVLSGNSKSPEKASMGPAADTP